MLFAIDPGTTESALLAMTPDGGVFSAGQYENGHLTDLLRKGKTDGHHLAIEMFASYGMAVGRESFETVLWTGRMVEAWGGNFTKVYRTQVKHVLCGATRAKDANVRRALINIYGGDMKTAKGTKKKPGPLYGVSKHGWAALGVAVAYRSLYMGIEPCHHG